MEAPQTRCLGFFAFPLDVETLYLTSPEQAVPQTLPKLNRNSALFLDVDGTLLDIAATPDAVEVPPDMCELLRALRVALGRAVALISGRPLADLDRLFAPLLLSAAGQHGAELRLEGDDAVTRVARDPAIAAMLDRLRIFAAERPGILIEDKGASLAIHYRGAPEYADEARRIALDLVEKGRRRMELLPARGAWDIKPRSVDKQVALEWFMGRAPFLGRIAVFIGDDRTDEDAFEAVKRLKGYAIKVGLSEKTAASWRIGTPDEVREWLRASAIELGAT